MIKKLTPSKFRDLEKRMDNYEYARVNCHFPRARKTAKGIVTLTKGTTKEMAVKKWYALAMKELDKKEQHYKSLK